MQRIASNPLTILALSGLAGGCLSLDAIPSSPQGPIELLDAGADAGDAEPIRERFVPEHRAYWLHPTFPYASLGKPYRPLTQVERQMYGDESQEGYSYFLLYDCLEGEAELVRQDQRYFGRDQSDVSRYDLLTRLGVDQELDGGLDMAWEVRRFIADFARYEKDVPPSIVSVAGPAGVDVGRVEYVDDETLMPTGADCEHGYVARVRLGARFVFAVRFEFPTDEDRVAFEAARGKSPLELLERGDFEALLADAKAAHMLPRVVFGTLQVGGKLRALPPIADSGCHAGDAAGLAACAEVVRSLREYGDELMATLTSSPSMEDFGGYTTVHATIEERWW